MDKFMLEVLPPPLHWNAHKIDDWLSKVVNVLTQTGIRTLNIPEVVEERGPFERPIPFRPKMAVDEFARRLRDRGVSADFVLNKNTVKTPKVELLRWVEARARRADERKVIFVGAESKFALSTDGMTVLEATKWAKSRFPNLSIGGIVIFHRRNEIERVLRKMDAGMEFFVSQIVFELDGLRKFVRMLRQILGERGLPKIFVSFGIVMQPKDLQLLDWFGVRIPSHVRSLLDGSENLAEHSIRLVRKMMGELMAEMGDEPIGVNLTHLMYQNIELIVHFDRLLAIS